jgi:integrase
MPFANPFATVFKFAEDRHDRRVPIMDEFWAVYGVAESYQDKLMLLTYLQTAARRDELFRLKWRDIDFEEKRIRLHWRKNAIGQWESAWLPIKEELIDMLRIHQKETGLLIFVFLNKNESADPQQWIPYLKRQHWLPTLCERAQVTPFGLHGIRHLTASLLAEANVPLVEIQKMLRHKSINTTQRYIHSLSKGNRRVLSALPDLVPGIKSPAKAPQAGSGF